MLPVYGQCSQNAAVAFGLYEELKTLSQWVHSIFRSFLRARKTDLRVHSGEHARIPRINIENEEKMPNKILGKSSEEHKCGWFCIKIICISFSCYVQNEFPQFATIDKGCLLRPNYCNYLLLNHIFSSLKLGHTNSYLKKLWRPAFTLFLISFSQ